MAADKGKNTNTPDTGETTEGSPTNFIRAIIDDDIENNKNDGRVATRFPPEPNGYLHIGHAKAICLNFGIAEDYKGTCNLRFDDTNPTREEVEYAESMKKDIRWLGFDWEDHLFYASDYFEKLYDFAVQLIKAGKAYVDDLSADEIREYRGTLTEPGRESPHRDRSIEENLDLFKRMRKGEFKTGEKVLRAKIDMASPNLNLRDPVMYRIMFAEHHRTGDAWCIYPTYDFTHGQSDSIEGITHSLCDVGFEDHRPLYDWFCENLGIHHPQQIEFARLNISHTVLSKRKLRLLVENDLVTGWDDARMPTLSGLRRRGYSPTAIRNFCERIGVAKRASVVDKALLDHTLREDLNATSKRVMGVLDPLKVVITNFPDDKVDELECPYFPNEPEKGTRVVPFTKEIYIEKGDFREEAPRKWFRMKPGQEVRLRYAYLITCNDVIKDEETGEVVELHCTIDLESRGGWPADGRKVRGTIHWVSADHAVKAEVRLFDDLYTRPDPESDDEGKTFLDYVNEDSLEIKSECPVEPSLASIKPGERIQFERIGYFCADSKDSSPDHLVFNRTVTLRDSWAKLEKKLKK